MIKSKAKKCNGTGKAKGHGCGKETMFRKYGLCMDGDRCFQTWLTTTTEGNEVMSKTAFSASKKVKKQKRMEFTEKKHANKTPHERFYKSTAWMYCSRYVLLFYSVDGFVKCATSGIEYHVTDRNIHCGHFVKVFDANSTNYATAFEFTNMLPQSYADNVILGGKPDEMAKQINYIHGSDTTDKLNQKKREAYKLDKHELDKWRLHYRHLFNELVKTKGNPWKN